LACFGGSIDAGRDVWQAVAANTTATRGAIFQ
jgi:hypothetical protein